MSPEVVKHSVAQRRILINLHALYMKWWW